MQVVRVSSAFSTGSPIAHTVTPQVNARKQAYAVTLRCRQIVDNDHPVTSYLARCFQDNRADRGLELRPRVFLTVCAVVCEKVHTLATRCIARNND